MTHDLTEPTPAPDDLRERLDRMRRRFRFLVEGAPDGIIFVLRAERCVVQSNHAFARLVGAAPQTANVDDVVPTHDGVPLERYIHPDHWRAIADALMLREQRHDGELVHHVDLTHQVTGERIPSELTFHRPEQAGHATVVFVRDLRERLRAQRQIDDYARALEQKNRDLRDTQAQLVQKAQMASLGALVAGVAHDINSPLGTIQSSADLTKRLCARVDGATPDALAKLLPLLADTCTRIAAASERIDAILRSLRSFARLDESEVKSVDLHTSVAAALGLVTPLHEGRIAIEQRLGELPPVTCRAREINQVILSLLQNAVQAIESTGTVTLTTAADDHAITIAITDTGHGIAPEHRARLFDPGFTTKGVGVGTGLGLAIASRIVSEHQGRIDVESELGVGSTFTVRLPRDGAAIEASSTEDDGPDMRLFDGPVGTASALRAAAETGLAARLCASSAYADAIARDLGLDERATSLVLDVLATAGYAVRTHGTYAATPTLRLVVDMNVMSRRFAPWDHTATFLRTGASIQLPRGSDADDREESYAKAIDLLRLLFARPARELAKRLRPPPHAELLDVGCGSGIWSLSVLEEHPGTRLTGLDFPRVVESFLGVAEHLGLGDRVGALGGNMHEVALPNAAFDIILLANVVHLEPEERLEPLFARLGAALRPGGELVIVDALHDAPACANARAVYALHLAMRVAEGEVHPPARLQQALMRVGLGRARVIELSPRAGALGALAASR